MPGDGSEAGWCNQDPLSQSPLPCATRRLHGGSAGVPKRPAPTLSPARTPAVRMRPLRAVSSRSVGRGPRNVLNAIRPLGWTASLPCTCGETTKIRPCPRHGDADPSGPRSGRFMPMVGDRGQAPGCPTRTRAWRTSRLARHAVVEIDDAGAEGAGLDELEIHPALALRKERNTAANQHRVDPGPVLVDQTQRIAARGIRWASHGGRAAVPPLPHTSRRRSP